MIILLTIHSIVRWILTLVAIALIVRLIIGLIKKQPFDKIASALTSTLSGLVDAQMLLGVLFFVLDGLGKTGFPVYRWEHAAIMVVAVLVVHLTALWKKKDDFVRTRNTLITIVIALLIIFIGIIPIGGWARWWHITGLF
jgi:hypothetical protein